MATSDPTNDPKAATADETAIKDLPESKTPTPDEEKNVTGGHAHMHHKTEEHPMKGMKMMPGG